MNRARRAPPRTGCGSISPMNTAAHPGWSSSNMKGPAPDIIRWNSLEISLRDISPAMVTRHTTVSPERITVTGCMAHARRRFEEALTVLKKGFHQRAAEGDNRISGNGTDRDAL